MSFWIMDMRWSRVVLLDNAYGILLDNEYEMVTCGTLHNGNEMVTCGTLDNGYEMVTCGTF